MLSSLSGRRLSVSSSGTRQGQLASFHSSERGATGKFGISGIAQPGRQSFSSPISVSTLSRPRRRKRTTRSATCRSAFSVRWSSAPSLHSRFRLSHRAWLLTPNWTCRSGGCRHRRDRRLWGSLLVKVGAVFGLGTVMLVMLLGQSRVFYSMSKDGLLWKWASAVHPSSVRLGSPTSLWGCFVAIFGALIPMSDLSTLVSIGTLLAFVIVCAGVWILRVRRPELPRPFRASLGPYRAYSWNGNCFVPHGESAAEDMDPPDRLAGYRNGDLLYLQHQAQQGAERASRCTCNWEE